MGSTRQTQAPRHVAIIMDGNGRWARQRGLPRIEGHRAGAETVRRIVGACSDLGVEYLTLYAFSTENWRRPVTEVRALMKLLDSFLKDQLSELNRQKIRLNAIGELDRLPGFARKTLQQVIDATHQNDRGTLTLALSYGARTEIVTAARRLAEKVRDGQLRPAQITEKLLAEHLYTANLPDPDLIIRTANEMRLSNFLLWQASYAEFWVTPTPWPEFSVEEFRQAIHEFGQRTRRFGAVVN